MEMVVSVVDVCVVCVVIVGEVVSMYVDLCGL